MIDELLESVAERVDAGYSPLDLINNVSREKRRGLRGYDPAQVEQFLGRIVDESSAWERIRGVIDAPYAETDNAPGGSGDPWGVGFVSPREFDELSGSYLRYR